MIHDNFKALFKDFNSWFAELAKSAEQCDTSSNLPKLELLLRSGQVIRGSVLFFQENGPQSLVMVLGLQDSYTKSEVSIVYCQDVAGLTLLEPEVYLKSFGVSNEQKTVGLLELKRAAKDIEVQLGKVTQLPILLQVDVDHIPDANRWDILRTAGFLPSVLAQIMADELGMKQVRDNIKMIAVTFAKANKTSLEKNILTISVQSPLGIPVSKEKERVKREIESVL